MALSDSQMYLQSRDTQFINRVMFALLQDVNTNRIQATPPAATDVTIVAQRDRLGRRIIAEPLTYATLFARLAAVQLIAKTDLLNEAVTLDADLFSAVSAVYDKCLPSL